MATKRQAPKPAPKPTRRPSLKPTPEPAPLDLVRNPNFDSAMANQNYQNSLAGLRAKMDARRETPTPPSGPLGGPVGSPRSKRDPSKEIILNFAGGEYGIRNDAAANAIAKKYNLEIVRNPDPKSALPNYTFKSNGNVNDIISQIKNEPGIGYAEQNFVIPPPSVRGESQPSQPRPSSPQRDPNTGMTFQEMMNARPGQGQFTQGRLMGAPSGQQNPNQMNFDKIAQGIQGMNFNPQPQQMQNYNNLLQQGIQRSNTMNQDAAAGFANLQPGMQPAQPAMPVAGMGAGMQQPRKSLAPRNFSTVNTPSARFG